ncbi:lipase 3-like [Scaptodrosophila lebanonensis]|uniref:Lipase n=1 Tax=Drosophila lebanonensis TaxID=7225 RepID=A0A6J2TQP1_DROLE|nr:lipase 3-like [Scaptodrosophila lebanonensis]
MQFIFFGLLCLISKLVNNPEWKSDGRIRSHGYPAERHTVTTQDGYVLTLFRIPYSHKLQNQNAKRPAVLLQHGLFSNSDAWLCSGPDNSLAYLLADAGYDVWLGNARGNNYSKKNKMVSVNSPKFWHFDWHEIGTIDIPAMIDYILEETGQSQVHYAGHSQGTTVYLVMLSERPEYNAKIKSGHLLAPCAFFEHAPSMAFKLFAPALGNPYNAFSKGLVDKEFLPFTLGISPLLDLFCGDRTKYYRSFTDYYKNSNMSSLAVLRKTHFAGNSNNQVLHYMQLWISKKFRQYDWGLEKNRELYGQDMPPDYDLSKITAATHAYTAHNDDKCGPQDVETLVSSFPHLIEHHRIPLESFSHLDFITAINMKELVNDLVVKRINLYEGR